MFLTPSHHLLGVETPKTTDSEAGRMLGAPHHALQGYPRYAQVVGHLFHIEEHGF
jgi:hypothetical protein